MTANAHLLPLVLITGSSRGLGAAIARAACEHGHLDVVGFSRKKPKTSPGERFEHRRCDLSEAAKIGTTFGDELAAELRLAERPRVALVNNAGVLDVGPVTALDPTTLQRTFTVNVVAPMFLHGWVLRHTGRGVRVRLVDVSSGAADSPYAGWSSYCATKSALDMAGRVVGTELAEMTELQERDATLVSYAPGVVETAMQEQIRAADTAAFPQRERFVRMHEQGELVDAAEPAAEIVDLLLRDDLPRFSRRRFGG